MKQKVTKYIQEWERKCYFDGIPDEAPRELESRNKVPSYRRICMAIMKNDTCLQTLGFTKNKSVYYSHIKYNEIMLRNKTMQLKLNL